METQTAYADYYSYGNVPGSPGAAMSFRKSDDIDFRDVFGGPPRRSSVHEMMRYSFTEGADSDDGKMDEMPLFKNPWTGAEEKPVFGGGGKGGNRRRLVREDFFVDIFGGSESPSSTTPRKHDRPDMFTASSPGSRALSPSWPLPPRADGFPGQTQFSLPDKLSKPVDSPALGSPARTSYKDASPKGTSRLHSPKISIFGFSTRSVQIHDESRNGITHYRPSPLSQKFSGMESPSGSVKSGMPEDLEKDKSGKQDGTSSPQFHFSIYKWASKGVPMMMPLKRSSSLSSREKRKSEIPSFDEKMESKSEVTASPSANQLNISSSINIRGTENQSTSNLNSNVEWPTSRSVKDEAPISRKQEKVGPERKNTVDEIPIRSTPTDNDEQIPSSLSVSNTRQTLEKEIRERLEQPSKPPELKPLKAFFNDKNEGKGYNKDVTNMKTGTNKMERSNNGVSTIDDGIKAVKKQDKDKLIEKSEVDEVVKNGLPRRSQDSVGRRRSKGKVNEFIKIFNQETPSAKPEATVHPQSHIFTKKEQGASEVTKGENVRKTAATNEKVKVSQSEKPGDFQNKGVDRSRESLNGHTNNLFTEMPSSYKNKSGLSTGKPAFSDPVSDNKVAVEEADELSQTYFTIKELPQDDNKPAESTDNREEIQAIDARIRQWSHGKKGNIRSLLSTLQYVLWPGSGWKPVPLVDIIEGPAVKRTYQRALLYLHPDKLKQKCAEAHQKHTAEKVFNILQEAWDHFNTLGSL